MLVSELIERLQQLPQDAHVYLDDTEMPTCLGLYHIESMENNGFIVNTGEPIKINTVILSTYNWREET